jgi:hypothetical protein
LFTAHGLNLFAESAVCIKKFYSSVERSYFPTLV